MASAKQDFELFVTWLHAPERAASSDMRKLANLALENFDALAQTSRHRSQRSIYLSGLIRSGLATATDERPAPAAAVANGAWPWKRLRHLALGPFRGFRTPEEFDLTKRIILFYGPNGSGKTSLCEGLEFALLGTVEEADNKRIESRAYLSNLHAGRFAPPSLTATDHRDREMNVVANNEAYRFCFIEKNRIDAFSRIAAKPAGQRAELIATLFGMDQFSDFISHFNESMDSQLTLERTKQGLLDTRREALKEDQAADAGNAASLELLSEAESALSAEYLDGMTYTELKRLIGDEENPGRLQELEGIINVVPPARIGLTRDGLEQSFKNVQHSYGQVGETEALLAKRRSQVSFKDLYTSVLALHETVGDFCPACDTPLSGDVHVVNNPYEKAKAGLEQLRELAELQNSLANFQTGLDNVSRELWQKLVSLNSFVLSQNEQGTPVGQYLERLLAEPEGNWWVGITLEETALPGAVSTEHLLAVADRIARQDAEASHAHNERQKNIDERDRLQAVRLEVQAQDIKRQQHIDLVAAAKIRIAEFEEANADLVEEVVQEAKDIDRDAPIKAAYDLFLVELKKYRDQLPEGLMSGLNELAMTLYNEINRNDLEADKLAELHLPLKADDKIQVVFRGKPEVRVDALHVLSEGHIRCLGLAILLAKAKSIGSPLVVFDDAINAIDHDHRGGIREAIFENDNFLDTQLIITCHGNEFIKDIQQHLPQRERNNCEIILFRNHTGDYQPIVTRNVPVINYLAQARAAKDLLNDREALSASRKALEMLTEKTWRWLASYEHGLLTLPIAGLGAVPALRNVCEALHKKLRDAGAFQHESKIPLINAYGSILGIPEANLVWTYLNKGTHEEADRDDFDAELVEIILQTLVTIDALDQRQRR